MGRCGGPAYPARPHPLAPALPGSLFPVPAAPACSLINHCSIAPQVAPRLAVRAAAQTSAASSFAGVKVSGKAARRAARRAAVAAQAKVRYTRDLGPWGTTRQRPEVVPAAAIQLPSGAPASRVHQLPCSLHCCRHSCSALASTRIPAACVILRAHGLGRQAARAAHAGARASAHPARPQPCPPSNLL